MASTSRPAGGRATESGMSFQAGVGSWFAAHLATATPLGARFGLSTSAVPTRLQFETNEFLDDIVLGLSDGGSILVQCKTTASLSSSDRGPLGVTINQLVSFLTARRQTAQEPDPSRIAAVLAVAADAPASIDHLEAACRYFDLGATWADAAGGLNQDRLRALEVFAGHVRREWSKITGSMPGDTDLTALARLFHITRFDVVKGGADEREAGRIVGAELLGDAGAGMAAFDTFSAVVRRLIQTGAPADKLGLLRRLRNEGFNDTRSRQYDADIARLRTATKSEISRLSRHARLPTSDNVPIPRECATELRTAIDEGSLLVIGEPGAGKTGVLVAFAEPRTDGPAPLVFISVDRLGGVSTSDGLRQELGLDYPLLDVLDNWPGLEPGILVIDALDASRGGPAERVFAQLIEDGLARLGERWSIVASIRTFDLKNGTRFRNVVKGEPPSKIYRDADLPAVRHFLIPRLTEGEVGSLAQSHPELSKLAETASGSIRQLLRNVFNLSLAAELISHGVSAESISTVTTQADLIERYEDERLPDLRLRRAVADALKVMVEDRRITVRAIRVANDAIEDVLKTGVMAAAGDNIAFTHHVLFDHAASRYYLDRSDPDALFAQVSSDSAIGFLLGPALRFAMERVWREDDQARRRTWKLIAQLCASQDVDPVVTSVALRTAAEGVSQPADVEGLLELLHANSDPARLGLALHRLARFVSMVAGNPGGIPGPAATAWASVARKAVARRHTEFVEGTRFLLWTLAEKANFEDVTFASAFGQAARDFLALVWSDTPRLQGVAPQAIRFVTKSFATDPVASRQLLEQILVEPRFSAHAHEEAQWLAEGVGKIAPIDPEFAFRIYQTLFSRGVEDGHSWLGGQPSRIMALSSNRRQDYEHGRWQLKGAFPQLIKASPAWGARAASAAAIGAAQERRPGRDYEPVEITVPDGRRIRIVADSRSLQDWRDNSGFSDPREDILAAFAEFLRKCKPAEISSIVGAVTENVIGSTIWARLFGIGAERLDIAGDLLWPIATAPSILEFLDLSRDAIIFLAASHPKRSVTERRDFETALTIWLSSDTDRVPGRQSLVARLLSTMDDGAIVTPEMRDLKAALKSEDRLVGNLPYVRITSGFGRRVVTDDLLKIGGADPSKGPDKVVRDPSRALEDLLNAWPEAPEAYRVTELWDASRHVVVSLDTLSTEAAHVEVRRAGWGGVSNAVEKIAGAEAYDPDAAGHPGLNDLLTLLDRLIASEFPEVRDPAESNDLMAWGNWDVRVYAALAAMSLSQRFSDRDASIADRLVALVDDPVPTVRLQISQSLNTLWDVARPKMWELVEKVAHEESDPGVLGFFAGGTLSRISEPEPARVEALVDEMLPRLRQSREEDSERVREPAAEAFAALAARLWVGRGRPAAESWIRGWLSDLARGEPFLWQLVSVIRGALFERYERPEDLEAAAVQERARVFVHQVAVTASEWMRDNVLPLLNPAAGEDERQAAEDRYRVGDRLLDHVCNQLYFGSGVFRPSGSAEGLPALAERSAKRDFLDSYSDTLALLGETGTPRTLHHLVELYEFLADAAPEAVFDRVADILVGSGAREGYQFESLGSDVLVRLVRRYLADYREVFEDAQRRDKLVEVLELFSGAGWSEALKLLYELPDLLR